MSLYLGKYVIGCTPPESALGVFEDTEGQWYAHCWREDYGPFRTAEVAIHNLMEIAGASRVLDEGLKALALHAARMIAPFVIGLAAGSLYAAGLMLLLGGWDWLLGRIFGS
jgi:hypothetical protein